MGWGRGAVGSLLPCLSQGPSQHCLAPSPLPTGFRLAAGRVAAPAERKECSAEQEGRLRRSADLAEGWARGTQGSRAPGPQCSGVDRGLLPLEGLPTALGGTGWSPEISERRLAWPQTPLESQLPGPGKGVGGTQKPADATNIPCPPNVLSTARSLAGQTAAASPPCRPEIPE